MTENISKEELVGVSAEPNQESVDQLQRGPYRQYEELQTLIDKIREYRRQRYPDSEIMKMLDNMPRRTYYNYVKKMQEQDKELVEQWMHDHTDQLAEELFIFKENASQILRQLKGIIDDTKVPVKERIKAIRQYFDITQSLVTHNSSSRGQLIYELNRRKEENRELWLKRSN